ncbi:chromosomal replication initiator protein DnaA [bacterium]|nr:chromosomal replication initiator protein DnaA [bacterium]
MKTTELWEKALEELKKEIGEQQFTNWLKPIKAISFNNKEALPQSGKNLVTRASLVEGASEARPHNNQITLEVPNAFTSDWIKSHYLEKIKDILKRVSGEEIEVKFSVGEAPVVSSPLVPKGLEVPGGEIVVPRASWSRDLNPKYTFEGFVVGPSNRFAQAACLAVAEAPARRYNPLFIYGGVGLGKTHLLHAIGHFILNKNSNMKVMYVTTEKFMNEMINAIQHGIILKFRSKYRTIDALLIDDIQFLANKESTQEEFFHTFNELHNSYKQIVISCDRLSKEIPALEERLKSRFEWGLTVDIKPPDLETRIAILKKKAEIDNLSIPEEVIFFIANGIKSNIREMEGSLIRVVAFSSLTKGPITEELAKEVLKDSLEKEEEKRITIDLIQKVVAAHFDLHIADMKAQKRTKAIAFPRQIAMYLSRNLTDSSLPEIGENFGGRDHTTVMHGYDKIKERLEKDPDFGKTIERLIKEIKE